MKKTLYKCKKILYSKEEAEKVIRKEDDILFLVIGILFMAVVFDLQRYRIPNLLTVTGITMGIVWSCYRDGWKGVPETLAGIGFPIILLFVLHRLRMLGAGDIKLFAVIGSFIGYSVWKVMLYSFIAGGCLALIQMLIHHSLVSRLKIFWKYSQKCFQSKTIISYESGFDQGDTNNVLHFSVAVFLGFGCWLLERWLAG